MIDKTIGSLKSFLDTLDKVESDWIKIYNDIGLSDQEISDLLHEIELTEFNIAEGNDLSLEIKKVRKGRRDLKDYQEIIRHLKEFLDRNKNIRNNLRKVLNGMEKTREYQNSRSYTPRVRTDLKLCTKPEEDDGDGLSTSITKFYNEEQSYTLTSRNLDNPNLEGEMTAQRLSEG